MNIFYKAPSGITIKDGYLTTVLSVETINLRHSLALEDDGYGQATIDGYLQTQNDGYYVADAYIYNFSNEFAATSDGYGKITIALSPEAGQLSPGFTWGRSGNVTSGAYLQNDTVPSNLAGRLVSLDAYIVEVFVANENTNTFDVTIQKRLGPGSFSDLTTVSLVSERSKTTTVSVFVAEGDELAAYISSGSAKNPVLGLVLRGT